MRCYHHEERLRQCQDKAAPGYQVVGPTARSEHARAAARMSFPKGSPLNGTAGIVLQTLSKQNRMLACNSGISPLRRARQVEATSSEDQWVVCASWIDLPNTHRDDPCPHFSARLPTTRLSILLSSGFCSSPKDLRAAVRTASAV